MKKFLSSLFHHAQLKKPSEVYKVNLLSQDFSKRTNLKDLGCNAINGSQKKR